MNIKDFEERLKNHKFDELPIDGVESSWQEFLSNQTMTAVPAPVPFWKNWKNWTLAACVVGSILAFYFIENDEHLSPINNPGLSTTTPSTIESNHPSSVISGKNIDTLNIGIAKIERKTSPLVAKTTDINGNRIPNTPAKKSFVSVNETNFTAKSNKKLSKTESNKEDISTNTKARNENFDIRSNTKQNVEKELKSFSETTSSPTYTTNVAGIQLMEKADDPSNFNNAKSGIGESKVSETTLNLLTRTVYPISSSNPVEFPIPTLTTGIKILPPTFYNHEISLIGYKVFNQKQVAANILYTYRVHKNFGLFTGLGISKGHYRFDKLPKDFPASMHHMPSINKVAYGTQELSIPVGIEGRIKLAKMTPYTRLGVQFATNTARDIEYEHIDINMGENKIEKIDRRHTNKELQYQFAIGLSAHLTQSILIRGEFLYSSDFQRERNFKSHALQVASGFGLGVSYIL